MSDNISKNKTRRVLILVMSTLPPHKSKSISTYQYFGRRNEKSNSNSEVVKECCSDRKTFKGISQLEPGTKYYINSLAEKDIALDNIVVLASDETRKKNEDYKNELGEAVSAVELYKTRIEAYINNVEADNYDAKDKLPDIKETVFEKKELYGNNLENFILIIPNKEVKGEEAIESKMQRLWDAANAIKGLSNNNNICDRVELYIDMQGGLRHDYPAIDTILSLLSDQKIQVVVKERVATEFNSKNAIQPTFTVNEDYRYYDLVSAYQIFKKYGWGDELNKYFENGNVSDSIISEAITKVSEAIKQCDVDGFDNGLKALSDAISKRKEGKQQIKTEMDFIIDQIETDFEGLLYRELNKQIPFKYVSQIRWCLKKNFVQQALTILESKMPTEYVWNGLYYYCGPKHSRKETINKATQLYDWYKNNSNDNISKNRYKMLDFNHFWIRDFHSQSYIHMPELYGDDLSNNDPLVSEIKESIKNYKALCNRRNDMNHAKSENFFIKSLRNIYPNDYFLEDRNNVDIKNMIEMFLDNFEGLANKIDDNVKKRVFDIGTESTLYDFKPTSLTSSGKSLIGTVEKFEFENTCILTAKGMGLDNATPVDLQRYCDGRILKVIFDYEQNNRTYVALENSRME